jgi:hypothetical protein
MVLRNKVAKLENKREIERVERMVRDLQASLERKDQEQKMKDLEQKMERMQVQAQAALAKKDLERNMDKKDLEQKMETMQAQAQAALERKDLEKKMETMHAHAAIEKKVLEQKMERMQAQAQVALKRKDRERKHQITRMESDVMMRAALENEKRDRLLENEKRDRLLENEKRDREADKKEAQHQIEQLKWEARFSQMEQQQAARAYNIQPLSTALQYGAGTVLQLAPQRESKLQFQPTQLQELRLQEEETGSLHSMTPVTATQPVLQDSTAISDAAISSTALPLVATARSHAASMPQQMQHLHQSTCDTPVPSRTLQQQQQHQHQQHQQHHHQHQHQHQQVQQQQHQQHQQHQQQQHQVTAGPAARAGPVPLPDNARNHFFLSHCQGTGGDQTNAIYLELKQLGFSCW